MPKVSVIVPVYNVEAYLRQCLDSFLNQTLQDIEIVCVDDGSTDSSAAILAEYARDPRVRTVRRNHANAGVARNEGMALATGEWLSFADADDFAGAEMLARLTTAEGAETADVVVAGHRTLEGGKIATVRLPSRMLKGHDAVDGVCRPWLFLDAGVMPWNKLFRRSFVEGRRLAFQDVRRHNDVRFVCCALAAANGIAVSNTCGYVYRRGRDGGITESRTEEEGFPFAAVLLALRRELEGGGLFVRAAAAYANLALAHCYYHLLGGGDAKAFAALYRELHGHLLADLGLADAEEGVFVNRKHYGYLRATLEDETPLSLWMLLLKERYDAWKALSARAEQMAALQKQAHEATAQRDVATAEREGLARQVEELTHARDALRQAKDALESAKDELAREKETLTRDNAELDRARRALKMRVGCLEEAKADLSHQLNAVLASRSYRLGRLLTGPFRFLRDLKNRRR